MMDAHRWERAKELFEAALEREEPERSTFLAQACKGDEELRREVESLLTANRNAGDFMRSGGNHLQPESTTFGRPARAFSAGQIINERYEILRFIARGGMGEVYEARDMELGTHVALKTVRPEISAYPEMLKRFKQELKLNRRVTHPNVCRMYHLEPYRPAGDSQAPTIIIITMELLEGETLASRLRRQVRLSAAEALPLVRQMGEGLAAAHEAAVVHCDFKPGNVMLVPERPAGIDSQQPTKSLSATAGEQADGDRSDTSRAAVRAVITDFGLARAIQPSPHESLGGSLGGPLVGTPAYMAPEQLEGRKPTAATDVYALGLVIYEVLTGHRPFEDGVHRRLQEQPIPARAHVPDLDERWERVISRCLERHPASRFSSGSAVLSALTEATNPRKRRIRRGVVIALGALLLAAAPVALIPGARQTLTRLFFSPSIPSRKNLVVLPVRAVDRSPEEDALCDGFTQTVTAKLAQVSAVDVAPAESVREHHVDTYQRARTELGANLVLNASWEQIAGSIIVNLALVEVDAKREKHLAATTVKGTANHVANVQDQVVLAALEMLQVDVSANDEKGLTAHGTNVLTAYDFYVQGIGYLQSYERPESLDSAITLLNRAVEQDRNFAKAQAALAEAYWYKYSATKDRQWADQAQAAAKAAEASDSDLPDVLVAIGELMRRKGDYNDAVSAFKRALAIDPANVIAYQRLGDAYDALGQTSAAEQAYRHAIQTRPSYWECYNSLGIFFYDHARYQEAAQTFQTIIDLAPDNLWGYENLGNVYLALGQFDLAGDFFRRGLELVPDDPELNSALGTALFFQGHYEEAASRYERATARGPQRYEYWGNLADAYRMVPGKPNQAVEDYRRAAALAQQQLQLNPRAPGVLGDLAYYSARLGNQAQARRYLKEALTEDPTDVDILRYACVIELEGGNRQAALNWLAKAVHAGLPRGELLADPDLASLHSDPEFTALAQQAQTSQ
jgi:serine/threonine protein kinase/tetratricopeptide (TPR) repeat protein